MGETGKDELSPLELRVLMLLRKLKPFEKLEVKYDKAGEITVLHTAILREVFPAKRDILKEP